MKKFDYVCLAYCILLLIFGFKDDDRTMQRKAVTHRTEIPAVAATYRSNIVSAIPVHGSRTATIRMAVPRK
ncbi:MAG: hypothetical protein HY961_22055 [Ignavibacteriae bacterium]|nr:hypothetical protein [Ignavibacteriota bacterium]